MTIPVESSGNAGPGGLIGLDWGTSRLRAFLMDDSGKLLEAREQPWGIRFLPEGGCERAYADMTAGWPILPSIACGMVGSSLGWREAPYVALPADALELANRLVRVNTARATPLYIVPGLHNANGPDVMRGEETQLIGGLAGNPGLQGASTWILPGTHSKWVSVRHNRIVDFATVMTGELYAVLGRYSILHWNQSKADQPLDVQAFTRGVVAARESGCQGGFSRLFTARSLMLDGLFEKEAVADYLSGLLIGEELRSMVSGRRFDSGAAIQLVGASTLCERYVCAAKVFDLNLEGPNTADSAKGLWRISQLAKITGVYP